jgi:ADP-ribose pyrophosphatase
MSAWNGELRSALADYHAADDLEARHHAAFLELLSGPAEAFRRGHFTPGHVTASVFIIDAQARALLLHHHRRLGRWLQMGGHVEEGESTQEAALREGKEESGLADLRLISPSILDLDVHRIPAGKGEPDHFHFDVRYLASTLDPSGISMDRNESNQLAWIALEQAEALINEAASSRVIRKIRSRA